MNKRGTMRGEMATLPKLIRRPLWAITACVAGFIGLMVLAVALAPVTGDNESAPPASSDTTPPAARTVLATATPTRTNTPGPTNTPTLTPTPRPTNTPVPPTPVPTPIAEAASGSGVISGLYLPSGIWVARWTHQGGGNFAVWAYPATGSRDLLINEIGAYSGTVMLLGPETYDLDITAGGSWTMAISPVGVQSSPDSSDRGDAVTGLFPVSGSRMTVTATHSGSSNFAVWLHCDKGSALFKNEIGRVGETSILSLPSGARTCLWEITADGDWSLIVQ